MERCFVRPSVLCRLLCILALVPALAQAQTQAQTVTWVITDGEVRRDGEVVPSSEWPRGLEVEGIALSLTVTGETVGYFRGSDHRLYAAKPRSISLVNPADLAEDIWLQKSAGWVHDSFSRPQGAPDAATMMGILNLATAASEVQGFLRVGQYLQDVQESNLTLYADLKDEWKLEWETAQLAHAIRRLPAGEEREVRILELQKGLESIFELKQQNRRQEVAYLEAEIAALRARLSERQRQKKVLVNKRLRELLPNVY